MTQSPMAALITRLACLECLVSRIEREQVSLDAPMPKPEAVADWERHAEIGRRLEAFETVEIVKQDGWRCWANNNWCPSCKTPLEAFEAARKVSEEMKQRRAALGTEVERE